MNYQDYLDGLATLPVDVQAYIKKAVDRQNNRDTLEVLGEYWELLDDKNRWGGNFTSFIDTPHFERKVI